MSAEVINFLNPLTVIRHSTRCPELITIDEHGDKWFVQDMDLGIALGYQYPLAAIEVIYLRNCEELSWRTVAVELNGKELCGRKLARAFDLEGAMRICEIARTPASYLLYAKLSGHATAEFAMSHDSHPRATVIPFPNSRPRLRLVEGVQHG